MRTHVCCFFHLLEFEYAFFFNFIILEGKSFFRNDNGAFSPLSLLKKTLTFKDDKIKNNAYSNSSKWKIQHTYCKYEIPDHKVGIYCNGIGPLAESRHSAFSCKKVLRYFCQNRRTLYSGTVRKLVLLDR